MSKLISLDQLENLARRTKSKLGDKSDDTATKNYVRTIRTANDGVEFLDGNGTVVFKIPVMEE